MIENSENHEDYPVLLNAHQPQIDQATFIASTATLIGCVNLDPGVTVWYGAVLRGDVAPINVGSCTNIQDGAILHGDPDQPVCLGSHVTIGHRAVIHGATIEDGCLIGIGSIILNGVTVGSGSIVGAGSVVTKSVPPRSLVMGIPGKIVRQVSDDEAADLRAHARRYQRLGEHHHRR